MVLTVSVHATYLGLPDKNESCFGTNIQLYTWILRGYSDSWVVVRDKYVHYLKLQICDLFLIEDMFSVYLCPKTKDVLKKT